MSLPLWKAIVPSDDALCTEFVRVMQVMDPRYRALTVKQFQEWLNDDIKPQSNAHCFAFAWFPRVEDMDVAARVQIVLLCRHEKDASTAELLMLGWAPSSRDCQPSFIDSAIDAILAKGVEWLGTLAAATAVKQVSAIRPYSMDNEQAKALHDRIYVRSIVGQQGSGSYIALIRERPLRDASYWLFQLTP